MGRGSVNAEKTHCPREHAYTSENTGRSARGQRYCKKCARDRARERSGWSAPERYRPPRITREVMWAVGLFEGEGCISVSVANGTRVYVRMQLGMTDRDVIERFQRAVGGVGHIKESSGGRNKPMYCWTLSRQEQVRGLYAVMRPHLSSRRQSQGDAALLRSTWRATG